MDTDRDGIVIFDGERTILELVVVLVVRKASVFQEDESHRANANTAGKKDSVLMVLLCGLF